MINIGTAERPILVPTHALEPNMDLGREYWEGIASGSIVLTDETLDRLIQITSERTKDS
ncbi:MAG: hypothetical protein ACOYT7_02105 [Patescibacteria group bacterium]